MLFQLCNLSFLVVSDCQTLKKSCSIESRNDQILKNEGEHETKFYLRIFYSTHVWMAEWNKYLTSNPVMVSALSSVPTEGNFEPLSDASFCFETAEHVIYFNMYMLHGTVRLDHHPV